MVNKDLVKGRLTRHEEMSVTANTTEGMMDSPMFMSQEEVRSKVTLPHTY